MKILNASVQNFASYKQLDFNFYNKELTLIHGATGSGKSTLQDIVCWILFGKTAKGGSVNDIKSWYSNDLDTVGLLLLHLNNESITIYRSRGNVNDLYFMVNSEIAIRGKDIKDTQKLLNERLQLDYSSYMASSYYCEYSPISSFFIIPNNKKKELLEEIVDLSFPLKIEKSIKESFKTTNETLIITNNKVSDAIKMQEQLAKEITKYKHDNDTFEVKKQEEIQRLKFASENFKKNMEGLLNQYNIQIEQQETKIKAIQLTLQNLQEKLFEVKHDICPICSSKKDSKTEIEILNKINNLNKQLIDLKNTTIKNPSLQENPYEKQLEIVNSKTNIYTELLTNLINKFKELVKERRKNEKLSKELEIKKYNLELLKSYSLTLRGTLVNSSIKSIELQTNKFLTDYFSGEFTVKFLIEDDQVDLELYKNGYKCSFLQLSKGQRGLLKLCFSISFMLQVHKNSRFTPSVLFFDEALDGLDINLKLKSFNLFQELEKNFSSIFIIEHSSEFKNMFSNQYEIKLVADESIICEKL